jgi:Ferritin-like domain/TAT (twin-arginine translocation) pathway signal sequence
MDLDRRHFLKAGSVALLGAALAACTQDKGKPVGGQTTTTTQPTTTSSGASPSDIALLKTAASLEALAVGVYQRAAGAALIKDPEALDTTTLFMAHHTSHQLVLNALLQDAKVSAVTAPNGVMDKSIFQPGLTAAKTQDDIITLLFTLEEVLAQVYVYSANILTQSDHRLAFMEIAATQARHRALLGFAFGQQSIDDLVPASFAASSNPLPADALLN